MGRFDPLPPDPYGPRPGDSGGHYGAICSACREQTRLGTKFCTNCNGLRDDVEQGHTIRYAASRWMRFLTRVADSLIVAGVGLIVFLALVAAGMIEVDLDADTPIATSDLNAAVLIATAIWFLWFAAVAPRGLTPAKQLLGLRVIRTDGADASTGQMWQREGFFQLLPVLSSLLAEPLMTPPDAVSQVLSTLSFIVPLADAILIFSSPDRQTLHDRLFGTLVINVRAVGQPSAELRAL